MPRNRLDRPKFVQLHPDDDGFKLDPVFYGDPKDFVPKLNVYGEAFGWGLRPHDSYEDVDISRIMGRVQYSQMIYDRWEPGPPENQFVNALAKKKSEALFKVDIEGLCHCDYILNIVMPEIPSEYKPWSFIEKHEGRGALGPNLISRRCKVSGGINLDTFQDKVLQPLMGWDRNSHAFVFTDLSDGASFGPRGCSTIDMMYRNGVCYEFLPADDYVLAHLARKKGDVFEYFYDFGDHWYHRIEVEEIIPRDQSDGAVVVLGGNAMCPPENARGNRIWASKMYEYYHGSSREKAAALQMMDDAPNYQAKYPYGPPNGVYDLLHFSIEECQDDIARALSSHASVRTGGKGYVHQFNPTEGPPTLPLKRGQTLSKTFNADSDPMAPSYMQETISNRRDRTQVAICATCGTPHELKACSRCRKVWYCGPEHQKKHWRTHKPSCKSS